MNFNRLLFLPLVFLLIGCSNGYDNLIRYSIKKDNITYKIALFQDSTLYQKTPYIEGKKHGFAYEYYKNGAKKRVSTWSNGKKDGHFFEYFKATDTIIAKNDSAGTYLATKQKTRLYEFYDFDDLTTRIRIDEEGCISSFEGSAVVFYMKWKDKYSIGDTLRIDVQYAVVEVDSIRSRAFILNSNNTVSLGEIEVDEEYMVGQIIGNLSRKGKTTVRIETEIWQCGTKYEFETFLPSFLINPKKEV